MHFLNTVLPHLLPAVHASFVVELRALGYEVKPVIGSSEFRWWKMITLPSGSKVPTTCSAKRFGSLQAAWRDAARKEGISLKPTTKVCDRGTSHVPV